MAAKFANVARITLKGDESLAASLEGKARVLMGEMLESMDLGKIPTFEKIINNDKSGFNILVADEQIANENGVVNVKIYYTGMDEEIKLKANLAGEAPIIEIEIYANKLYRIETSGGKFSDPRFSIAFEGDYDTQYPNGRSPVFSEGVLTGYIPSQPSKSFQYVYWGDMHLIPPEDQSTEILIVNNHGTKWFDSATGEAEVAQRSNFAGSYFSGGLNPVFGDPYVHTKTLIASIDNGSLEYIDETGWGQYLSYSEAFTDYGGTTVTFGYYPELTEMLGQRGQVGMMVQPTLVNEELDISLREANDPLVTSDGIDRFEWRLPDENLNIKAEVGDGWYIAAYRGQNSVPVLLQKRNATGLQDDGAFLQNMCVTLGFLVYSFPLKNYEGASSPQFPTAVSDEPYAYLLAGLTLINPKEGIVHHYTGEEGDASGLLVTLEDAFTITKKPDVKVADVLKAIKPTYSRYWFEDLIKL